MHSTLPLDEPQGKLERINKKLMPIPREGDTTLTFDQCNLLDPLLELD